MYRVLIVDDESLHRESLAKALPWNTLGFQVIGMASHGLEALRQIEQKDPHVVISDIKMPIMDGIELCKQINLKYPSIKVIILSGYNDFEYAQKAIEYKVFSYMLKPVKEEEVIDKLRNLYADLDIMYRNYSIHGNQHLLMKREQLEEYYLYGLIHGHAVNTHEYKEALKNISVDIEENFICVIACLFENVSSGKLVIDKEFVKETIKNIWGKNVNYLFTGNHLYIILHEMNNLPEQRLHFFAKRFKSLVEIRFEEISNPVRISAGIGGIYSGLEFIGNSASEASKALESRFFNGKGSIVKYSNIYKNGNTSTNSKDITSAVNVIVQAIRKNDLITLRSSINCLFEMLASTHYKDTSTLFIKCVQVYSLIIMALKEVEPDLQVESEEDIFHKIIKANYFEDLKSEFINITINIYNNFEKTRNPMNDDQVVKKLKAYIFENYKSDLSLNNLSALFHMNPSYLSSIFKEKTGENISDLILSVRMKFAKKMLESSNKHIQEISSAVGYNDYRYFCTIFKKNTGITPLQYRLKKLCNNMEVQ